MRRVLVTGATGLIGRNVVSALRESGVEVHAVTRSLTHVTHDGEVRWHKANLLDHRDRTQLLDAAAPQTVIHCAWVTEHGAYWTSPENLDWVGATLSLAREAHDRGTSRFVGVGTCAKYEWGGAAPLSEASTPLRPQTLYGVAKNATRSVLDAFCTDRGLEFAWGRVAMLYGAGAFISGTSTFCILPFVSRLIMQELLLHYIPPTHILPVYFSLRSPIHTKQIFLH